MSETNRIVYDEDDYLHVGALILDYLRFLRRTWYILVIMLALATGIAVMTRTINLRPAYQATVYYSLNRTSDVLTDAEVTARVAEGVSTLTTSADFKADLYEALGVSELNAVFRFSATLTPGANLFSVTATCYDAELVNHLLYAFEQVYPKWVNKSVGKTVLTITDEVLSDGEQVNRVAFGNRLIIAYLIVIAIWFIAATIRILSVQKIRGEDDMYQVVNARCLGILPDVAKKKRDKSNRETLLISNKTIDGNYLQAMRSIAARIESGLAESGKKVVMITSTHPKEGKSIFTINLAMILHRHGKSVVIVDGDMHQSGISRILQMDSNLGGLSDYLNSNDGNFNIFYQKHGLVIVPAGTYVKNAASFMSMKKLDKLFNALRTKADVVLIDTPPTAEFGDAILFSEHADEVVYLVRGDYAEVRDIRKGIEPFVQSRKLFGYALNRINSSGYGYGYRYGYGADYARYRNYGAYGNRYGSSYSGRYGNYSVYNVNDFEPEKEEEEE